MKKIILLFTLVFIFTGCGNRTHFFTILNQSDWDIVVELQKFKEFGKYQAKSNYMVRRREKVVFEIYNSGSCSLISVNGAKLVNHNSSEMILSNSTATEVNVINLTKKIFF